MTFSFIREAMKEEVPDAMDGLSDSDLETLLKNFNELSAEEQHSLIAYLKKLEAREPQRVERLRQYVSVAATQSISSNPPPPVVVTAPPPAPSPVAVKESPPVVLESDDDDYTVEEVSFLFWESSPQNSILSTKDFLVPLL